MMWTAYKKEIMEKEKEESDFLKRLFDQAKTINYFATFSWSFDSKIQKSKSECQNRSVTKS